MQVGNAVVVLSKSARPLRPPPPPVIKKSLRPLDPPQPAAGPSAEASHENPGPSHSSTEEEPEAEGGATGYSGPGGKGLFKRRLPETSESSSQESSSDQDDTPVGHRQFKLPTSPPRYRSWTASAAGGAGGSSSGIRSARTAAGHRDLSPGRAPSPVREYAHHRARVRSRTEEPSDATQGSKPRAGLPAIRPNAMKNRQKQLETLKKYEEKLRSRMARPSPPKVAQVAVQRSHQHPMMVHTLDVSRAISEHVVTWRPVVEQGGFGPEETIFYSVVEGRGELVVFGGMHTDLSGMQRGASVGPSVVTNRTHFLAAPDS